MYARMSVTQLCKQVRLLSIIVQPKTALGVLGRVAETVTGQLRDERSAPTETRSELSE